MARKQIAKLKTHMQVLAEEKAADAEFFDEWQRTALARAVAAEVISYRSDRELTQAQLAKILGMRQPQVARLESGETNPRFETLMRISERLGIEFAIDIAPAGREPKLMTKRARDAAQATAGTADSVSVLVAAD